MPGTDDKPAKPKRVKAKATDKQLSVDEPALPTDPAKLKLFVEKLEQEKAAREQALVDESKAVRLTFYRITNSWHGVSPDIETAKRVALRMHGELAPGQTVIWAEQVIDTGGIGDGPHFSVVPFTLNSDRLPDPVEPKEPPPPQPKRTARNLSDEIYSGSFDQASEPGDDFGRYLGRMGRLT